MNDYFDHVSCTVVQYTVSVILHHAYTFQESDYILSSNEEGPQNPVVQQARPLLPPEVLNHAQAQPAPPRPQPHPALPLLPQLNNAEDDMVDLEMYRVMTLCLCVWPLGNVIICLSLKYMADDEEEQGGDEVPTEEED